MAANVNFVGNLTKDPVIRGEGNGKRAILPVAVTSDVKDDSGKYRTMYYTVAVFGKRGEMAMDFCQKGTKVAVNGTLDAVMTTKDGKNYLNLNVKATDIQFVHNMKPSSGGSSSSSSDDLGDLL